MRNNARLSSLQDALLEELQTVLCLEKGFMMSLPMMAQHANNRELQSELERLCGETREQISRLQGLLPEGIPDTIPKHCEDVWELPEGSHPVQQALIVAAVQKMQHEKIALYSTACLWAKQLELPKIEQSLALSLQEEEKSSQQLHQLAQRVTRLSA